MMKKILTAFVVAGCILLAPAQAGAEQTENTALNINAPACILLEAQSGDILYKKNADEKHYPASVTKLMTLVLACEAIENGDAELTDVVTTSKEAASMGGSQVYLFEGEQRSLEEMLIAVAVGSGNDASYAVAEFLSDSCQGFVQKMNDKAAELGMAGTHFCNPHGLHDDEHYTTAADLAILACYAVKVPKLLEFTEIYEYDFRPDPKPLKLWNTNRLLKWYDGTDGLKTGYTDKAGRNLAATAERDGLRLISVVLGATERNGHYTESMKLLNYGFNLFSWEDLYPQGAVITNIPIEKGVLNSVDLMLSEPVRVLQRKGEQKELSLRYTVNKRLLAPCEAGKNAGELIVYQGEKEMHRYPLVTAAAVEKCGLLTTFKKTLAAAGLYF